MKNHHKKSFSRALSAAILVATLLLQAFPLNSVYAANQITTRSLQLQAGATDGGSMPGGIVNHLFSFTLPTAGDLGSIKFEYCTLAAGDCTTPTGLVTTSATLGSETGATGFVTMENTTNGAPYIARASATAISADTVVTYQLQTITNPTDINKTFFVRISTYASIDATGTAIDAGTVAASTADQIILDGTMPESLVFCTGATIGLTAGVPDCNTATDGTIHFNQLFSPTDTATSSSQMAASTNAGAGYVISVNGPTLTSGSNTITGMPASALGVHGISQFGLNLKANTIVTSTTPIGTEVAPAANALNYRGKATADYGTVDYFKFVSGDPIAKSDDGGAGGTDAQIFTVSYIANVPGSQPAGTYTTTLTYICTPSF